MVTLLVRVIGPLVRRMGEHDVTEEAKVMACPEGAAATSARSEPAPESLPCASDSPNAGIENGGAG
jgi:hypothetical protein